MRFTENIIGLKVYDHSNHLVGKIDDLIVAIHGNYPKVNSVVVKFNQISYIDETPLIEKANNIKLIVPFSQIIFSRSRVKLRLKEEELNSRYMTKDEILVKRDLIDCVIVTSGGQSIGRVNDVVLFEVGKELEIFGLSVGIVGIVAKLGLEIPIELLDKGFGKSFVETVINWKYVKDYHPHKNEVILSVSQKIEAAGQIDYIQSKETKKPNRLKRPPFIIIPWLLIEKAFKKKTSDQNK